MALAALYAVAAWGQTGAERDAMRQQLAQQRSDVESRHQQALAACYQRFVVTPCLNEARDLRRKQLDEIRRQENLMDLTEREEKAQQRLSRIDQRIDQRTSEQQQKAGERAARDAAGPGPGPAADPGPIDTKVDTAAPAADGAVAPGDTPADPVSSRAGRDTEAQRARKAAEARARMAEREQQAQQRRRERDERLADPARRPASPLPAPQ